MRVGLHHIHGTDGARVIELVFERSTTYPAFVKYLEAACSGHWTAACDHGDGHVILCIDTTKLPLTLLCHAPAFRGVYKRIFPCLKQHFTHSIVVVQNPAVRMAIDTVIGLADSLATEFHTASTHDEAQVLWDRIVAKGKTTTK